MHEWLEERRAQSRMQFEAIPFAESREWLVSGEALRHQTGSFFSVEGVQATSNFKPLNGVCQPIINQPEGGILGFLVHVGDGDTKWLVQAKAEPGNMKAVQLAPTVQATFSNYMRKHGGAATEYLEYFTATNAVFAADSLQSEQGTRFLRKFNRNCVAELAEQIDEVATCFRWLTAADMRTALRSDYAINTDARSVIVCAPWLYIAGDGVPFQRDEAIQLGFDVSYREHSEGCSAGQLKDFLYQMRQDVVLVTTTVALNALDGWDIQPSRVVAAGGTVSPLEVRHYQVKAPEREKTEWDQPLMLSSSEDEVVLFSQVRDGVLKFLLRPAYELGLTGGVEFGPSYKAENAHTQPDWLNELVRARTGTPLVEIRQSDEGGRFMLACSRYAVERLDEGVCLPEETGSFWVTLGDLEGLCREGGLLTNEARSIVSLLLAFA